MRNSQMMEIKTPEKLREAIQTLGGGRDVFKPEHENGPKCQLPF